MASKYPSKVDIETAMKNPGCYLSMALQGGSVIVKANRIIKYSGGFSTVFPFLNIEKKKIAVKCWSSPLDQIVKRTQTISSYLKNLNAPYFVCANLHEKALLVNGEHHPVVIMDWVDGTPLKDYISKNILDSAELHCVANNFLIMVQYFHRHKIAHGDLHHENILVMEDCSLVVIDYDSMYVSTLGQMKDVVKGKAQYQHPARQNNEFANEKLDYFSELVIYLSLLGYAAYPSLFNEETEHLLFKEDDFEFPDASTILRQLANLPDPQISLLTKELISSLEIDNINRLQPLENLIYGRFQNIVTEISDKF